MGAKLNSLRARAELPIEVKSQRSLDQCCVCEANVRVTEEGEDRRPVRLVKDSWQVAGR